MENIKRILLIIIVISFFLFLFTLQGCKTVEKIEYRTKYDTVVVIDHKIDSLYVKDSTYIYSKADTVYISKWYERIKYIEKKDSIYINSTDTLYIDKVEYKEVDKKRPTRDIFAVFGLISVVCLVGFIFHKIKS